MARKGYPAEFRRRALDLVAAGKTVAEVARLLEVSDQSIYTWRRHEVIDRGELAGLSSTEREELRAARLRIRELETELAVVLDAFSRRVVGWSISHNPTAALASNALGMAIEQREAARKETVIHSDHGTQFTPGRSPSARGSPVSCRRWDRSAIAMTTR
jgi:transposase